MTTKSKQSHFEELILHQGLVLESEVYTLLARKYALRLNPISKVCFPLVGRDGEAQEVDVLAVVRSDHQVINNPFFNSVDDNGRALTLGGVANVFLIECKGHSTDGVLLGRLHHQTGREKLRFSAQLSHYQHTGAPTDFSVQGGKARLNIPGRWLEGISRIDASPIIDNCSFYNFIDKKDKAFSEAKDKLFKATQQISSAGRLFDGVLSQWRRNTESSVRAYTVTPIICTNIPITVMQIQKDEVHLIEVDWAFILNPQFGTSPTAPNKPDFRLIPVVQSSALTRFCDAVMSDDPNGLSIDISEGQSVHSFNFKEAQRVFRESE
jgi:hypothetical protein